MWGNTQGRHSAGQVKEPALTSGKRSGHLLPSQRQTVPEVRPAQWRLARLCRRAGPGGQPSAHGPTPTPIQYFHSRWPLRLQLGFTSSKHRLGRRGPPPAPVDKGQDSLCQGAAGGTGVDEGSWLPLLRTGRGKRWQSYRLAQATLCWLLEGPGLTADTVTAVWAPVLPS